MIINSAARIVKTCNPTWLAVHASVTGTTFWSNMGFFLYFWLTEPPGLPLSKAFHVWSPVSGAPEQLRLTEYQSCRLWIYSLHFHHCFLFMLNTSGGCTSSRKNIIYTVYHNLQPGTCSCPLFPEWFMRYHDIVSFLKLLGYIVVVCSKIGFYIVLTLLFSEPS